ncbi:MAG: N-acetylglucosaminyl-diphospho-decaprenol L-rhamnosyltransferase [Flavobacterium sp. SCGC AAA160-P02]|nr:MAG: N-acetylglucosaminyl-diphospho-decaprenol L-rhamnosyltransferase [Flavobacterium sp. SCGC AAA160-P02]
MLAPKNKVDVSIIIVNYKSWNHLRNCLDSIQDLRDLSFIFETIVIDNHSNDGNLNSFSSQFPEVDFFLNSRNNGFANGCNFGASKALGDYFLFLNPDTIVNATALEEIFHVTKRNPSIGISSCLQKKESGSYEKIMKIFPRITTLFGFSRAFFSLFKNTATSQKKIVYPDWVSGSLVFISRQWFEKINGWNEDYWMYYEDVDLCKKIYQLNGKVAVLTSKEIIHKHGGASRINIKTSSITKTEVQISKHVYVQNHFKGIERIVSHFLLIINNILIKAIFATLGVFLFFIPKMRLNVYLFIKIIHYYFSSLIKGSWLSGNSTNSIR